MKKKKVVMLLTIILAIATFFSFATVSANGAHIVNGDTTENIKVVQQKLKNWGYYSSTVDGIWGSKTTAAVKSFQKKNGLIADGIVGKKTEEALGVNFAKSSTGSKTSTTNGADVDLLAKCVYGESRGEPYIGQVAIAAVILNRVKNSQFPNSIAAVIYQPLAFTAVADGQINLSPNESAYKAARDAINGWDPTNGCLYYYNPKTATSKWIWQLKVELTIGQHSFARGT